jgi:hypothetical protein
MRWPWFTHLCHHTHRSIHLMSSDTGQETWFQIFQWGESVTWEPFVELALVLCSELRCTHEWTLVIPEHPHGSLCYVYVYYYMQVSAYYSNQQFNTRKPVDHTYLISNHLEKSVVDICSIELERETLWLYTIILKINSIIWVIMNYRIWERETNNCYHWYSIGKVA